jgi:hypothetical protein
MSDDELIKITDQIQEKLGADNAAVIADDLGLLITANAATQKALQDRDNTIRELTDTKERLIAANGNLLKQVPVVDKKVEDDEKPKQSINLADAFDARGNFRH